MRTWLLAAGVLAALGMIGFVAMKMMTPPPEGLDLARAKTTEQGLYDVAIAPVAGPVEQGPLHAWIATVTAPDGEPVTDATLSVDGGMPQHGHGLPTAPQASAHLGEGRYRIEGVRFNMGGWWVLKIAVSTPAGDDVAVFNLSL